MITVGKFETRPLIRQLSRWEWETATPLRFNDPVEGVIEVPGGFCSDLASIRILREICRWAALLGLLLMLLPVPWLRAAAFIVALVALILYALIVGYGVGPSILHDFLYRESGIPRPRADAVYYRALHTGDGIAAWRSRIFWSGVRVGGWSSYKKL